MEDYVCHLLWSNETTQHNIDAGHLRGLGTIPGRSRSLCNRVGDSLCKCKCNKHLYSARIQCPSHRCSTKNSLKSLVSSADLKLLIVSLFLMEMSREFQDLLAWSLKQGVTISPRSLERNLLRGMYCGIRSLFYSVGLIRRLRFPHTEQQKSPEYCPSSQ